MSDSTRVSIIITSYDYGRFLAETIDSALRQTHPNVEVIVVDDGSTDNSREVMSRYEGRIIPILKANGGQASAFNAGFAASSGQIIWFLDSDDQLLETAAAEAARLLRDPSVVNVHWSLHLIDQSGNKIGGFLPLKRFPDADLRQLTLRDGPYYDWNHLSPTSGNAWSRRFLERVLPMPVEPYRTCADEYLFTLAPVYGKVEDGKSPQGCYRSHESNHGWGQRLDDGKVAADLARLEFSFEVLARHLRELNMPATPADWRERNWNYLWMRRLLASRQRLRSLVPIARSFVLADGGEWGDAPVEGRRAVRFLERDGHYGGPPADDRQAIEELERTRHAGCDLLALWWTQQWWIEAYPLFFAHLRSRFRELPASDGLVLFDLGPSGCKEGPCA